MILIELQTDITPDQWDKIVEHSETEKALLLSIIDFSLDNMYTQNFIEKLETYVSARVSDLEEKNSQLEMFLPVNSIRATALALLTSIKKSKALASFLRTVKYTVTHHTKFTYKGSITITGKAVQIPEVNFQFNVKYNLVGNRFIDNVNFCYVKKLATFVCRDE